MEEMKKQPKKSITRRIIRKQEGIQPVSATHGFKFEAPDGKLKDTLLPRLMSGEIKLNEI